MHYCLASRWPHAYRADHTAQTRPRTFTHTKRTPHCLPHAPQVAAFIGESVMAAFLTLGLLLFLVGIATLIGIGMQSDKTMAAVFVIWFLLLFFQVVMHMHTPCTCHAHAMHTPCTY